jgi:hypothetical protein
MKTNTSSSPSAIPSSSPSFSTSLAFSSQQFNPYYFLRQLANMTIHVVGDSISAQHYKSLICELSQFAFPSLSHQMKILNLTFYDVRYLPSWLCLTFSYAVTICWANDISNHGEVFLRPLQPPDILLWNVAGLHSHSHDSHLQKLHRVLFYSKQELFYPFNNSHPLQRILIYRETTPQAFNGSTLTGDYDERSESNDVRECRDFLEISGNDLSGGDEENSEERYEKYLTYRQRYEREIFRRRGIPLLSIHDLTLVRGVSQYVGYPDCSHFCEPGTPLVWNLLLYRFVMTSPLITALREAKATQLGLPSLDLVKKE